VSLDGEEDRLKPAVAFHPQARREGDRAANLDWPAWEGAGTPV